MIFVTVGSQKFQFNRLLKKIDELVEKKIIEEPVFAQIGVSDYKPKNYKYKDFIDQEDFNKKLDECSLLITHAGTGVIMNGIKRGKKVIAIPRLEKYKEHVDDHQIQIVKEFDELNFIEPCNEINEMENAIIKARTKKYNKYISNTDEIISDIESFIERDVIQ